MASGSERRRLPRVANLHLPQLDGSVREVWVFDIEERPADWFVPALLLEISMGGCSLVVEKTTPVVEQGLMLFSLESLEGEHLTTFETTACLVWKDELYAADSLRIGYRFLELDEEQTATLHLCMDQLQSCGESFLRVWLRKA